MHLAIFPPMLVALATLAGVAFAGRLRVGRKRWPMAAWLLLSLGGVIAAVVVRAVESLVVDLAVGGRLVGAEGVRDAIVAFGLVGPLTVLSLATIVWPTVSRSLEDDVDPPLAAAVAASGFVVGRLFTALFLERAALGGGVRAAIVAVDEVAIAAWWGYGLARSGFDGKLGGTPFGRYAIGAMIARGAIEVAMRGRATLGVVVSLAVGLFLGASVTLGVFRLARHGAAAPTSLASVGQETIREIAREQLRRGGVRPLWIAIGALGNVGGMLVGFASAVIIGRSARIDFGEIDRSGPAAEYAALLLVLGVVFSFPMSAAVIGLAGGGRRAAQRPYVLEAGLSAVLALAGLLVVLGVIAPVGIALGVACAPVAFVLAGLGAWIASGRR